MCGDATPVHIMTDERERDLAIAILVWLRLGVLTKQLDNNNRFTAAARFE